MYKFVLCLFCSVVLAFQVQAATHSRHSDAISKQALGITGGKEAVPHSIPYQAILYLQNGESKWWCSGNLISGSYILTSASCIAQADNGYVFLGVHENLNALPQNILFVNEFLIHPDFNSEDHISDIGLIHFGFGVHIKPSDIVQYAPLPSRNDTSVDYFGYNGRISGWGLTNAGGKRSDVLLEADNIIVDNNKCGDAFGSIKNVLCSSGAGNACDEDTGAPLVVNNTLIGILSYGSCGVGGSPSLFVKVSEYIDWLEEVSDWRAA